MSNKFQAVKGMPDILPEQTPYWRQLEQTAIHLLTAYGYREIRLPIVEHTELFRRSIGEVTDIVEKEMYTFTDQGNDSLTLRPEATASCVRACVQHGLLHNQTQRLWCIGPMFRRENPQRGRYRQFHQIDVEAFGMAGPDIDAELICLTAQLWRRLGLTDVTLQLNSLGTSADRERHRQALVSYLERHRDQLDEESQRRLTRNPLRILDSKNPAMAPLLAEAPKLLDHLSDDARAHFETLQAYLQDSEVEFTVNPRLVRGLDYYSHTVFEWVTDRLGAQGTVCAGGRYDGLVAYLGGRETPGIGFAMGVERLLDLLQNSGFAGATALPHAYMVRVGEPAQRAGQRLAEQLRQRLPALRLTVHMGGGSFKSQFKRADQSGAELALIIGDEEANSSTIAVKPLRREGEQITVAQAQLADYLDDILGAATASADSTGAY